MIFVLLKNSFGEVTMKIQQDKAELKFLGIKRSLSWLYLFKSGESWYNSKGYYEDNYHANKILMDKFIQQSISELNIPSDILRTLELSEPETIQAVFNKVSDILKGDEGKKKCCQCIRLLDITINKFTEFLTGEPDNQFMRTKFNDLWYKPSREIEDYLFLMLRQQDELIRQQQEKKGGRKTRKQHVKKGKNTRKSKKIMKRRTKKNKRNKK